MMDEFPPDESGGNVPNIKRTTAGRSVYEIRNIDGTDDDTTGPYKRNVSPPSNLSSGVDYGYDATAVNDKFTGTLPTRKSPESLIALGTLSSLYAGKRTFWILSAARQSRGTDEIIGMDT